MNLAFSVIAMEWFDKISEFMEGLPEWLQAHPRYGYLIVVGTLGERSYRFWLGLIVAAATGCALLLFFVTG